MICKPSRPRISLAAARVLLLTTNMVKMTMTMMMVTDWDITMMASSELSQTTRLLCSGIVKSML